MSKDFQDGMMLRVFKDVEAIVIKNSVHNYKLG
jgi:hypothetical protein